jgi:hypothetical protein
MKTRILLVLFFLVQLGFSQERTCGMEEKMAEMMFNPLLKQKYEQRQIKFEQELLKLQSNRQSNVALNTPLRRIPVAVHYPEAGAADANLRSCLRALAQNQIDILNADYNATNVDLSIWNNTTSANFPTVNVGSLNVNFELATQNHPANSGLTNGQVAVTFGYDFGDRDLGSGQTDWDSKWIGYLNIIVKNLDNDRLGYAYLGSSPSDGAAVFITSSAFGSGVGCTDYAPVNPYNKGRTLTHELGHYFNLEHIWGRRNCGTDFVADTPQHDTANGGCPPSTHRSSCSGSPLELTMNYMDYTNDACMYMFTAGQAQRQQSHLNTIASFFKQNTLLSNGDFDKNSFVLYPNPNKGSFNIQFSEIINDYSVQIFDNSGRVVFENKYSGNNSLTQEMNLNATAAGVYFVTIKSDDFITTKKVLVQ